MQIPFKIRKSMQNLIGHNEGNIDNRNMILAIRIVIEVEWMNLVEFHMGKFVSTTTCILDRVTWFSVLFPENQIRDALKNSEIVILKVNCTIYTLPR